MKTLRGPVWARKRLEELNSELAAMNSQPDPPKQLIRSLEQERETLHRMVTE